VLAIASFTAWGSASIEAWTPPAPALVTPVPGDIVIDTRGRSPIGIGAAAPHSGRLLVIRTRLAYEPPAYCG
jgi:hypothetical protein